MKNHLLKNLSGLRKHLLHAGLALIAGSSFAQTTLTIGTGTSTASGYPVNTYYGYTYSQNIYTASDIVASGGGIGTISKVRFYLSSGSGTNSTNWTVYLGHTNKTSFANNTNWEPVANLTNCFSGTVSFPAGGNWLEVTLSTPFQWNGVDNIIVAVDENQAGYGSYSYWRYTNSGSDYRAIYYYSDSNNPDPANPPTASGRATNYSNVQFEWTPAPNCAGTPAPANTMASQPAVCTGNTVNLSLDQSYFYTGITYQWQENDGAGWNNIPGETADTYTSGALTAAMDYRCVVTCTLSSASVDAAPASISINPNPVITIDHPDIAICGGEPANLTASGADTYVWSPTTLLTPSATSPNVNVIPATTTVYTVQGTDANGCIGTATALITPVTMVSGTVTADPSENCSSGSPITLQVTGLPAEITSGGTWEYRWLASDSVTVLQDWNSSDSYTFIPSQDSIYGYFYQVRSTSCPSDYVDSVYTSVTVGFGADADLTHYNCNTMGGTIALQNAFGQIATTDIYNNNLGAAADLTNITFTGNASIADNMARLTPSATSQGGYMQLVVPGQALGLNNAMTVSFNMTADTPINTWGTGGADGIAYSFGDDATPTANGNGMNGRGTKLRLSFDAAGNSGENGNQSGIYLVYGWTANNAFGPASAQTLAYSSNTALWKNQTNVPVQLHINTEGKATLTVAGTVVFDNIQLPAAYMNADATSWKHLFSAQTGGDAMRQGISNLDIKTGSLQFGISAGNSGTPPADWQTSTTFDDLLPGSYDVWIGKDESGNCMRNIGTFEILNTNPVVELGNDTIICAGETLTLDAGNPGSTYIWSNSNNFTQTLNVTTAGSYIVYVTDPAGCLGIGTINVGMNNAPSASGIYSQGSFPTVFFTVTGAQNATSYDWNFGDGQTLNGGPASVSHTYSEDGTFTVSVTMTNDCGTATVSENITITNTASISENLIEGLEMYPNPAHDAVTIRLSSDAATSVSIYAVSGALVQAPAQFHSSTTIDVSQWERGVYFFHIANQEKTGIYKLVVR